VRRLFASVVGCEQGDERLEVVVVDRSSEMRDGVTHRDLLQ